MKKTLATVLSFTMMILIAYTSLWFYGQGLVKRHVDRFITDAAEDGLIFQDGTPQITGFPFEYNIYYSGELLMDSTGETIDIPSLSIRSFFFLDENIEIELAQGASVKSSNDPWINSIDYFYTNLIIPESLPADMTQEGLRDWYNNNGSITFDQTTLIKDELKANARITLELNDNLQPDVVADGRIYGAVTFIDHLTRKGYLEPKDQLFVTTIISPLSRKDETSGEKYTAISIRLRNQSVLVGPLQVASFPVYRWPKRNPPALHQ